MWLNESVSFTGQESSTSVVLTCGFGFKTRPGHEVNAQMNNYGVLLIWDSALPRIKSLLDEIRKEQAPYRWSLCSHSVAKFKAVIIYCQKAFLSPLEFIALLPLFILQFIGAFLVIVSIILESFLCLLVYLCGCEYSMSMYNILMLIISFTYVNPSSRCWKYTFWQSNGFIAGFLMHFINMWMFTYNVHEFGITAQLLIILVK